MGTQISRDFPEQRYWELATPLGPPPRPLLLPPPGCVELSQMRERASEPPPSTLGPRHPLQPLPWPWGLEGEGKVPRMVVRVVLSFTVCLSTESHLPPSLRSAGAQASSVREWA